MHPFRRGLGLVFPLVMAACATFHEPAQLPVSLVSDATEARYRELFHEMEQCSGKTGNVKAVLFYTTTEAYHNGRTFDAYWMPGFIVLMRPRLDVVKHEIMHELLQTQAHPLEYFNHRCGDLRNGEAL
jgi:hypothetical protein